MTAKLLPSSTDAAAKYAVVKLKEPSQWTLDEIRAVLAIDRDDFPALTQRASHHLKAGDDAAAEEHFWLLADRYPCTWLPYNGLAYMTGGNPNRAELWRALCSLDFFYLSMDRVMAERRYRSGEFRNAETLLQRRAGGRKTKPALIIRELSFLMGADAEIEDPEDAERVLGHCLIRDLFQRSSKDLVERTLENRAAAKTLLTGVLRGFVRELHNDLTATRNALALLGEIGDLDSLGPLIEAGADSEYIEVGAMWALDRMKAKHGEEFDRAVLGLAAEATAREYPLLTRLATVYNRTWPPANRIMDLLAGGFSRLSAEDQQHIAVALIMTLIMLKHREGVEQARKLLRETGGSLAREVRSECDSIIADLGNGPFGKLPPPISYPDTVYDIVAGRATIEDAGSGEEEFGMDDDYEPVEQRVRRTRPGRNDPCWCGSGRKYKKCHLDADEASGSKAPV